jgi:predicted dehydrogenase
VGFDGQERGTGGSLVPVALFGCGRAAERLHLPALGALQEARLVAVADPLPQRRTLLASGTPGCCAFASAEALLQQVRVAAVIIATPPETHAALAALSLRAGIPVLVEKPLALSVADGEALAALAASANGSVMVGFNRRHWEPIRRLREILRRREHTQTVTAEMVSTTNLQTWAPIGAAGNLLDDIGSHAFDLVRFLFDRELAAVGARCEDSRAVRVQVRLEDGSVARLLLAQGEAPQTSLRVHCAGQCWWIRLGSERIQPSAGPVRSFLDLSDAVGRRLCGRRTSLCDSYERQLRCFFHFVRARLVPQPGIADGLAALRAVEAARRSAADGGKEVAV